MKITWDLMDGGRIEAGAGVLDISRAASVTDIPANATADPFVLLRALERGMSTAGQTAPGTGGRGILTNMVVTPGKATNSARIIATFSAPTPDPGSGGGAARWVIEDSGQLNSEHVEIDLLGEPLHTHYIPSVAAAGGGGGGGAFVRMKSGPAPSMDYPFALNVRRPVRILNVSGYLINKPSADAKECEGCVNALPWPSGSLFQDEKPKDKGCWLCAAVEAGVERPGLIPQARARQLYRVSARFLTRGKLMDTDGKPIQADRNWCDFGVHHNILGRIPEDMLKKDQVEKVRELMKKPYSVPADHSVNGYCRVGMYPVVDFKRAFLF